MATTRLVSVPYQFTPWYRSDTFNIVQGTPLNRTLSFDFVPDAEGFFSGPFKVQALYADGSGGFVMSEWVFAPGDPDFDATFDIGSNTAGYVYFRVLSTGPLPVGLQIADAQEFDPVAENEVPSWTPVDPNYEPPEPAPISCEVPAGWLPDAYIPFSDNNQQESPLVLDLDGDGIELTALDGAASTFFDIDNDGFAEATGWVGADDGLLAIDLNSNGTIDDASELFGSYSFGYYGIGYTDGFAMLQVMDTNGDLIIDQHDTDFTDLLVWKDANGDGISQGGELESLTFYDIASINLGAITDDTQTVNGNLISHSSTYKLDNGTTRAIGDAWFAVDNTLSVTTEDYTLDVRTLFLPTLRGYGELEDLHIAMSRDEDLLELVEDFATSWSFASFEDEASLKEDIKEILFKWAGTVPDNTYIPGMLWNALSEETQFLEAQFGQFARGWAGDYIAGSRRTLGGSLRALEESFDITYENLKAHLLVQVGAADLFENSVTYNPFTGEIEGDLSLSEDAINNLIALSTDTGVDTEAYWVSVATFLNTVKGFDNFSNDENTWLDDAISTADPGLDWVGIKDLASYEFQPSSHYGTAGSETVTGTSGDNVIDGGGSGNDTLEGLGGNDDLTASSGNDILIGGAGDDFAYGSYGDDTYVYTSGDDFYKDLGDDDVIELPSGIDFSDLTFSVVNLFNLFIEIDGGGTIEIGDFFYNNSNAIETLQFYSLSTYNLLSITSISTFGTNGDDGLFGADQLGYTITHDVDDTLYGFGGDDSIAGGNGNDTLIGGAGNDYLGGGNDDDTYIAGPGFDRISENGGGTDTIVLPDTVSLGDITFLRTYSQSAYDFVDLKITIAGLGQILVLGNYDGTGANAVENLYLESDTSNIDLTTLEVEARGESGNDTIYNLSGTVNETFNGMEGDDYMLGGAGNDRYWFSVGVDQIYENTGSDTIEIRNGFIPANISLIRSSAAGLDDLLIADHLGNTLEVINHFGSSGDQAIETVHFQDSTTWTISSMEIATHGTSGADYLSGTDYGDASSADQIYGFAGDDYLWGDAGSDTVNGGADNDYVYGGAANDTLYGEGGTDNLFGDSGADTLHGGDDGDTLHGGSNTSDSDDNSADVLYGNNGADTLYGNAGNDALYGGSGADTLRGGDGADTFVFESASAFSSQDTIVDFAAGSSDKIDLHDILDMAFNPLTDVISNFVNFTNSGSDSIMSVDRDGTGTTHTWTNVATLNDLNNLDETTLYNNGNLLAA